MLRPLANDQSTFFRKMSLPPILGSCAVVAFCQCLVYQVSCRCGAESGSAFAALCQGHS